MEAEDTVMTQSDVLDKFKQLPLEEWKRITCNSQEAALQHRKWQAEISFKAGMKEVVDWIEEYNTHAKDVGFYGVEWQLWQAKLKEWGI